MRPFGMAVRPDGKRALVPFFQTGNFGVLDLDGEVFFPTDIQGPPAPNRPFTGIVAVTPSIKLDGNLWPRKGEDVPLLFPSEIRYAQNGRFAVAVHRGSSGHEDCKDSPNEFFCKQSGAVSIIDDGAITTDFFNAPDLGQKLGLSLPVGGAERSYYGVFPLCKASQTDSLGNPLPLPVRAEEDLAACDQEVVTHLFRTGGFIGIGGQPFQKPSGLAIQPIVFVLSPRAGDNVWRTAPIHVQWRSGPLVTVDRVRVAVSGPPGFNVSVECPGAACSPSNLQEGHVKVLLNSVLFGNMPADGDELELTVVALRNTPAGQEEVSRTSFKVIFQTNG